MVTTAMNGFRGKRERDMLLGLVRGFEWFYGLNVGKGILVLFNSFFLFFKFLNKRVVKISKMGIAYNSFV